MTPVAANIGLLLRWSEPRNTTIGGGGDDDDDDDDDAFAPVNCVITFTVTHCILLREVCFTFVSLLTQSWDDPFDI
jgi:hypothetical protein